MRQFVSLFTLVGLLAGCDTSGDIRPIDDVMIVELADANTLRLETESYDYCGVQIYVNSQTGPNSVHVEVRGAEPVVAVCDALVAATWSIALPVASPIQVSVRHKGETDRYRATFGDVGRQLEAIRTSTTRLGPRLQ